MVQKSAKSIVANTPAPYRIFPGLRSVLRSRRGVGYSFFFSLSSLLSPFPRSATLYRLKKRLKRASQARNPPRAPFRPTALPRRRITSWSSQSSRGITGRCIVATATYAGMFRAPDVDLDLGTLQIHTATAKLRFSGTAVVRRDEGAIGLRM